MKQQQSKIGDLRAPRVLSAKRFRTKQDPETISQAIEDFLPTDFAPSERFKQSTKTVKKQTGSTQTQTIPTTAEKGSQKTSQFDKVMRARKGLPVQQSEKSFNLGYITKTQLQRLAHELNNGSSTIPELKKITKVQIMQELLLQIVNNKVPSSILNKDNKLPVDRYQLAKGIYTALESKSKNYTLKYDMSDINNDQKNKWIGDVVDKIQSGLEQEEKVDELTEIIIDQQGNIKKKKEQIDKIMEKIDAITKKKKITNAGLGQIVESNPKKKQIKNQPKSKFKINYV